MLSHLRELLLCLSCLHKVNVRLSCKSGSGDEKDAELLLALGVALCPEAEVFQTKVQPPIRPIYLLRQIKNSFLESKRMHLFHLRVVFISLCWDVQRGNSNVSMQIVWLIFSILCGNYLAQSLQKTF